VHPDSQDILATAAASIFQTEEISPPLIYSPTHEDNRLMIDDGSLTDPHHHHDDSRGGGSGGGGSGKKHKLTPVMAAGDRTKKLTKAQQDKMLALQQQKHTQESVNINNLLQIRPEEKAAMQQTFEDIMSHHGGDPILHVDLTEEQRKLRQHYQEQSEIFSQLQGLSDHSPTSISATAAAAVAAPVSVITSSLASSVSQPLSVVSCIFFF
jgi:hypothetical protein